MKNSNFTKIIAVVASVVFVICASVAITVMADSEVEAPVYTHDVGIYSMNVSYKAQTELAFCVQDDGVASEGAESREVFLLFFNSNPDQNGDLSGEELYRSAAYRKSSTGTATVGDVKGLLFYSNGILAKDLGKDVYVCPVVVERFADSTTYTRGYTRRATDGLKPAYSARACSVVTYAKQQIESRDYFEKGELELYSNILLYAAAISNKEGGAATATPWLIVNGGAVGAAAESATQTRIDASAYGENDTVLIRANAEQNGEYFLYWKDVFGNIVSKDRAFDAPARNDIGLAIYTSVYGTEEESVYADVIDFNDMNEGELVPFEIPAFDASLNGRYTIFNHTVGCMDLAERVFWKTNESADALEVAARAVLKIVKNEAGGKLVIEKDNTKFMQIQYVNNTVNDNARAVEFDLKVNELNSDKKNLRFFVYSNGSTGNIHAIVSMHLYKNENDKYSIVVGTYTSVGNANYLFNKDISNPQSEPLRCNMSSSFPADDFLKYEVESLDEILTVKYVIDDSGTAPVASVYINGKLMFVGSGAQNDKLASGYFESSSAYVSGSAAINKIGFQVDSQLNGEFAIDNIAFADK